MRRTPPYPLYRGRSPVQGESGVDKLPRQQSRPVCPGGVRIVRQHPRGSTPRPTTARDGYPDSVECRHHLRIITCLNWGDEKRHHTAVSIDRCVDLRRPPTLGPSETVIGRLSWVPEEAVFPCVGGVEVAEHVANPPPGIVAMKGCLVWGSLCGLGRSIEMVISRFRDRNAHRKHSGIDFILSDKVSR